MCSFTHKPGRLMSLIPARYDFLNHVGQLPQLFATGLQYIGIKEYPTKANNNPVILDMAKRVGVEKIYTNDEIAWCALFIFFLLIVTGKPLPSVGSDKYNYLRAKTFIGWGSSVKKDALMFGDIVVYKRPDGYHVAIFIAYTKQGNHIIFGANQSNSVTFTEIGQDRWQYGGRYYKTGAPVSVKKYVVDGTGLLSTNEA